MVWDGHWDRGAKVTLCDGCRNHVFEQTLHRACCLSCVTVLVHALRVSDTLECMNDLNEMNE